MLSGISLVAILLALNCAARAMDHPSIAAATSAQRSERDHLTSGGRVFRHDNVTSGMTDDVVADVAGDDEDDDQLTSLDVQPADEDVQSEIGAEKRDRPQYRKRKMDKTMMALLMAYKLKFIAMIPTMLGGLILLKGTTLLAGFFFALFAAVLGLKMH